MERELESLRASSVQTQELESELHASKALRINLESNPPSQRNSNSTVGSESIQDEFKPLTAPIWQVQGQPAQEPSDKEHNQRLSVQRLENEVELLRATHETLAQSSYSMRDDIVRLRNCQRPGNQSLIISSQRTSAGSVGGSALLDIDKVFPQDSFSFAVVSPVKSWPFFFSVFIYIFQMATFAIVTLDLVSEGEGGTNPFGIPGDVAAQLRAAQFIAIMVAVRTFFSVELTWCDKKKTLSTSLAVSFQIKNWNCLIRFYNNKVFTQGDLMTGFQVFHDGFHEAMRRFPHVSWWKFCFSLVTRLSEGSVGLIVSFLLIITAVSVVELVRSLQLEWILLCVHS